MFINGTYNQISFIKMQMNKITLRDARINIERLNHIEAVVEIANFYLT